MSDLILQLDRQLFFLINQGTVNPFFDFIMPLLRSRYFWVPLYLFLIVFFITNYKKQGLIIIGFILLTFAFTDFVSASIFKQYFMRLRPCNDPEMVLYVRNIVGCGGGYSFVSSHACNHFGIAIFIGNFFAGKVSWVRPAFITWATAICIAQVYVGVHYPFDVLCGAILGILLGNLTTIMYRKVQPGI